MNAFATAIRSFPPFHSLYLKDQGSTTAKMTANTAVTKFYTARHDTTGEMSLKIFNTLSRQKEDFKAIHSRRVNMFVCGITPYDHVHMGHAKTYVAFDVVARYLRYRGYRVFYVQNVTDVEDRLIARMLESGRDWRELVAEFIQEYMAVMEALNVSSVNHFAWATDYIPEIVEQIQGLIKKGYAYAAEGDVYYDTTKFDGWGKLSGMVVEELRPGARVEVDKKKRNPADFALWGNPMQVRLASGSSPGRSPLGCASFF